jgi:hypothetical protein
MLVRRYMVTPVDGGWMVVSRCVSKVGRVVFERKVYSGSERYWIIG